ncbi:MAG: serine protease [Chloroherpetonaceae bacterium]|nr:serine protease [Chthonomonadaceae bacterium]MDW8209100.1 serine protease [Chloroherpetonaceae bacterium]
MQPVENLIRQLPPLDLLEEALSRDPATVLPDTLLMSSEPGTAGSTPPQGDADISVVAPAPEAVRAGLVRNARRAIARIRRESVHAELPPAEHQALEAIVVATGRPAILIMNGTFTAVPTGWEILEQVRPDIERTARSVGRIEVTGHPALEWVGTGFLAGRNALMTNRHVAKEFARKKSAKTWVFEPGMTARVDYREEIGAIDGLEFEITGIIGVHDDFDLALLRVAPRSARGDRLPPPLPIATRPPATDRGRRVYVIGYPAWDGRRNDPDVMARIFANIFNVKRLQPGEILQIRTSEGILEHDCSTLGGNSGSCVVDMETHRVIGLHFSGRYLQANQAIALWRLQDDPLLRRARVHFL